MKDRQDGVFPFLANSEGVRATVGKWKKSSRSSWSSLSICYVQDLHALHHRFTGVPTTDPSHFVTEEIET